MFVAIQQVVGSQPTVFMKLASPMTAKEIESYRGKRLPLDPVWMRANGYNIDDGPSSTSPVLDVRAGETRFVLLVKTANSTYQCIPDFA